MSNIWQDLPTPFFCLAPMENVTDTVFRQIVATCGKPDVFFTEFTNTDGMLSAGAERVTTRFIHTDSERPLIAQIWGNTPEYYYEAAKIILDLGFDGIDINMGCPVGKVVGRGSCSGLINNPVLAAELIHATKDAVGAKIPVSVKTRLGFRTLKTEEWTSHLLRQDIAALTIHGRTTAEMSKVPAHWDEIAKVVQIRNEIAPDTRIIGNGDVMSYSEGRDKAEKYGVDGIMIGRGVFHNLWIFNPEVDPEAIPIKEKLELLIKHIAFFEKTWQGTKPAEVLKKFYKVYVSGMENASDFRMELMVCKDAQETITHLQRKINTL